MRFKRLAMSHVGGVSPLLTYHSGAEGSAGFQRVVSSSVSDDDSASAIRYLSFVFVYEPVPFLPHKSPRRSAVGARRRDVYLPCHPASESVTWLLACRAPGYDFWIGQCFGSRIAVKRIC